MMTMTAIIRETKALLHLRLPVDGVFSRRPQTSAGVVDVVSVVDKVKWSLSVPYVSPPQYHTTVPTYSLMYHLGAVEWAR